jgi:hypothetical protein
MYTPDGRWYWDGLQWRPIARPGPVWARPFARADAHAYAAVTFLALAAVGAGLFLLVEELFVAYLLYPSPVFPELASPAFLVGQYATFAGLIGAAIAVPVWMHRAYRNLPALGATGLRWSPAWAAAGWFIPLAQLVIPLLVAYDLSAHAGGDTGRPSPLLVPWWAAWLAGYVLGLVSNQLGSFLHVALAIPSDLALLGAGVLLILIIQGVTRRQRARHGELHGA